MNLLAPVCSVRPGFLFSRRDGELAFRDKLHDIGVVGVGGVKRHETRHAVDVAADAGVDAIEGYVLGVGVHD